MATLRTIFSINVAVDLPDNVNPELVGFFPGLTLIDGDETPCLYATMLDSDGNILGVIDSVQPLIIQDIRNATEFVDQED
jgi:hypothetical protein